MTDIWGFLLQTLTLSLTAGVLLCVKTLLREHLSPRWQYGVWSVLALRAVVPASVKRDGIVPFVTGLEALKAWAEKRLGMSSAFTEVYRPITVNHALPEITGRPASLTDWLFVVYAVGVVAFALWYAVRYVQLRTAVKSITLDLVAEEDK